MAKLQYGPIVTSASGKVAGCVFSIWKGVQYVKRWVKPTYTNTAAQQAIRDGFSALSTLWKYLPTSPVLAWTNYAKGKGMANRNAFIGANTITAAVPTIGQLTPHNPTAFPPVLVGYTAATPNEIRSHITWPPGAATDDVAYTHCIQRGDQRFIYTGINVFPATQVAVTVAPATTWYCHTYLCPTATHERSMSLGGIQLST